MLETVGLPYRPSAPWSYHGQEQIEESALSAQRLFSLMRLGIKHRCQKTTYLQIWGLVDHHFAVDSMFTFTDVLLPVGMAVWLRSPTLFQRTTFDLITGYSVSFSKNPRYGRW